MSDEHGAHATDRQESVRTATVVCVADRPAVRAVADATEETRASVEVDRATDGGRVVRRVRDEEVDCVVVDESVAGVDARRVAEAAGVPAVLYTDTDPTNVSEALLDAVDTLVEQGDPEDTAAFLLEKVVGLLGTTEERSEYALARALARVDDDAACEGHQFVVDGEGTVHWSSDPFESVFPVEAAGALSDDDGFYDRLAALLSDDPEAIKTVTRADRAVDASTEETVTITTADGPVHFRHAAHELLEAAGGLCLEVFRDVTPQVRREARLELLDLLVGQAQDGLYTLDENGVIDFCNESLAEMLGYDRSELIGRHAAETLAEGELEKGQRTVQYLQRADEESTTVDMTFVDSEGAELEVSIHYTLLPAADDSYAGLMGVARDITERKERERILEQYRTLVESAADPMYVLDAAGRIELLNEPMASFFGREKGAVVGEHADTLVPDENSAQGDEALRSILRDEGKTFESFESWLTDAEGNERLFEVTVGAIEDDGAFVGSVGTLRDITERERRREELDLLRQVFARVLRHNLRSELSIIMGNTEVLMQDLDGSARELAETVLERGEVLESTANKARAIEGVLDSETGRTPQSVRRVVDHAVEGVQRTDSEATVAVDTPPSLSVRAHDKLVLAVENLLENAIQHGAPLDGRAESPDVAVSARAEDGSVLLSVADGGPGIPECERRALERGAETPLEHGSGLGLWLVNWIVERSGRRVRFDDSGAATTVTMELEAERPAQ